MEITRIIRSRFAKGGRINLFFLSCIFEITVVLPSLSISTISPFPITGILTDSFPFLIISKSIFSASIKLMMNTDELVTDVGSVLTGEMAVKEGLIDEIGSLNSVIEGLYNLIEENI